MRSTISLRDKLVFYQNQTPVFQYVGDANYVHVLCCGTLHLWFPWL